MEVRIETFQDFYQLSSSTRDTTMRKIIQIWLESEHLLDFLIFFFVYNLWRFIGQQMVLIKFTFKLLSYHC